MSRSRHEPGQGSQSLPNASDAGGLDCANVSGVERHTYGGDGRELSRGQPLLTMVEYAVIAFVEAKTHNRAASTAILELSWNFHIGELASPNFEIAPKRHFADPMHPGRCRNRQKTYAKPLRVVSIFKRFRRFVAALASRALTWVR